MIIWRIEVNTFNLLGKSIKKNSLHSLSRQFKKSLCFRWSVELCSDILDIMWNAKELIFKVNRKTCRKKNWGTLLCLSIFYTSSSLWIINYVYRKKMYIYSSAFHSTQSQNVPLWSLHSSLNSSSYLAETPPTTWLWHQGSLIRDCGQTYGMRGGLEKSRKIGSGMDLGML